MVVDIQESTFFVLLIENGTEARLIGNGVMGCQKLNSLYRRVVFKNKHVDL